MLLKDYGREKAEKILDYEKDSKFFHIRINLKEISADKFEEILKEKNLEYRKTVEDGFYVCGNLDGIKGNLFTVQSLSSLYVCKAFGDVKDKNLLDLCAAPGGKSVYLSAMGAKVTSCDIHPHRVELIKKYAKRMGENLNAFVNDASQTKQEFIDKFDCVLCDVPCSGFGVADSKPDIKLFKTKEDIQSLANLQKQILEVSSQYVKVGGELVYSNCSILKEENEEIINKFLEKHMEFKICKYEITEKNEMYKFLEDNKYFKVYPTEKNDGFFICKLFFEPVP